jgi:GNAT superfamily N-acetyltransferase
MLEISSLTDGDRAGWEVLARSFHGLAGREFSDANYGLTWGRLLDGGQIRGLVARLDGKVVGFAHYLCHASVWAGGKCYLADMFVAPEVRRRGVARSLLERVARDARGLGATRLYWHTTPDNAAARALYDEVARLEELVVYTRRLDAH